MWFTIRLDHWSGHLFRLEGLFEDWEGLGKNIGLKNGQGLG